MSGYAGGPWLAAAVFLLGLLLGRFLNRCIDVFPRHESLTEQLAATVRRSSAERTLARTRRFWHWLPVVGWLLPDNPLSRGWRADYGRAVVELGNGLILAALAVTQFPNGFAGSPPDPFAVEGLEVLAPAGGALGLQLVRFLLHALLIEALLIASAIDLERMIIPDGSTIPAMLVSLVVGTAAGGVWLVPAWYEDAGLMALLGFGDRFDDGIVVPPFLLAHPHIHGLLVAVSGLVVGGGIVWAVRLIGHWALGREAMGFGDVILMALIGSVVGWQPVLTVFFLGPLCAVVVVLFVALTGASREFPYGPWLALATVLLLLGWQTIWPYASRFFLMGRLLLVVGVVILVMLAVLLRGMRLLRGDRHWEFDLTEEWTSADQLLYQSQEDTSFRQANWPAGSSEEWPGVASGRGEIGECRWRSGSDVSRWQSR